MPISTSEVIYLGNYADADTDEGSASAENPGIYLGVFGSSGSPLQDQQFVVSYDDVNSNGSIETDNGLTGPAESISYDLGAGPVTTFVDSLAVVSLTVTYNDASSASYSNAVMYQDSTGNLFLTNSNFAGTDLNGVPPKAIQSVNVTSANANYTGLFQNALQDFVCFGLGTLIATPSGARPIEHLSEGDLITTRDHGTLPILWIGQSIVHPDKSSMPITIRKNALGSQAPNRDLLLSPQHRILIEQPANPAHPKPHLLPIKKLTHKRGIKKERRHRRLIYFHLMTKHHAIVFANGLPCETFLPRKYALGLLSHAHQRDLKQRGYDLETIARHPAHPILTGPQSHRVLDVRAATSSHLAPLDLNADKSA